MIDHVGVRSFQKYMTKYINGNDIVIIEDGKTHNEKGVFIPYNLYTLFKEQVNEAIKEDIRKSFVEEFDAVGVVNEN
jgi:hypothetical protein